MSRLVGKNMLGKPIFTYDSGGKFKTIADRIFDQENDVLFGFLADEVGWCSNTLFLPPANV